MKNYDEMYQAFGITEASKGKFNKLAESEYSKDFRVAKVEILTKTTDESGILSKKEDIIDAELV